MELTSSFLHNTEIGTRQWLYKESQKEEGEDPEKTRWRQKETGYGRLQNELSEGEEEEN